MRDPGLPDDWGSYYRKCELCGGRWHASEGGCDCVESFDEEGCKCGKREWINDGTGVYCDFCNKPPGTPLDPHYWDEEDATYTVVVIEPGGPGKTLGAWERLDEVHDWLERTGAAYQYSLGVAIYNAEEDVYDCEGKGEFLPEKECWG